MATVLCSASWFTWSRETYLIIQNRRFSPIDFITVRNVDSFDFEKGSGPREKFNGISIPAKRLVKRRLELNHWASNCPVTMDLNFNDGSKATFTINMKYALHESEAGFSYEAPFSMTYNKVGTTVVVIAGPN
ncbi:hypothetical protein Zmor_018237 [Zophobas morio]|uniref:Uncharacterized protein n=1 Tax=Zophobas morio TaxID=2755281 RepID=A0AA38IE01_9CUCU|nr:hypothetical protein Zmor_018237 [Zophobas morio]